MGRPKKGTPPKVNIGVSLDAEELEEFRMHLHRLNLPLSPVINELVRYFNSTMVQEIEKDGKS